MIFLFSSYFGFRVDEVEQRPDPGLARGGVPAPQRVRLPPGGGRQLIHSHPVVKSGTPYTWSHSAA